MKETETQKKDNVTIAFNMYEHVYTKLNNSKIHESNKHELGNPARIEHDLNEREKEHLALLRSKLAMEISNKFYNTILESSQSNDRLGKKVFWLNIAMALLTLVMAVSAVIPLLKK